MKSNIVVVLGTDRQANSSERVVDYLANYINGRDDAQVRVYKPAEAEVTGAAEQVGDAAFTELVDWADGLIIVTPEYNHSYPGSLKRLLDTVHKRYIHKGAAIVGVSSGSWGGTRAVQALMPVLRELGLITSFTDLYFPKVKEMIDDDGKVLDEQLEDRTKEFVDELLWVCGVLSWGRDNLASSYHQQ